MERDELSPKCVELMGTADAAYLSTVDTEGYPQTRAMVNLRNRQQFPGLTGVVAEDEDDLAVYMTTDTASGKFQQIKANPKASVYFCDPKEFRGLLLIGQIEVVTDKAIKHKLWQDAWKVHYPGGPDGPEYNIIRLRPVMARCWFAPMPGPVEFTLP